MDQVFKGANILNCYIDDILMHSKGLLQHLAHLEELLKRLHKVNVNIHPKKCEFVVTSIVYLGHIILPNGIMAYWAKVVAILEMPNPIDVHTLRSFIGLCNYYMIYVQDFNTIAHPLYALLNKDVVWTWSEEAQEVFTTRNSVICNHDVCNWDATVGHMQLSLVFYATTMDFRPLFGCVCNYGATMITFIPTFG
jgi:hypothetical protein